ncbi:MAG: phage portal protein [Bacillota bacterium]
MRYTEMLRYITAEINKLSGDKRTEVSLNSDMADAIEMWAKVYEGHAIWLSNKKGIKSAGIAASVSAELARLTTLELQTSAGSAAFDAVYLKALDGLRAHAEQGCATGGMVIKPYQSGAGIDVQFLRADRFYPLGFNASGDITACVFVDQAFQGKNIYTRLEYHALDGDVLTIRNLAFSSSNKGILGAEITLAEVEQWADIQPEITFSGADKLPIGFFRVPFANNIDPDSPLGVSVFARAIDLIKEADRRYSNECWEYEATQVAVHIAQSLLKRNPDTDRLEYPGGKERLYRQLEYNVGASDKPLLDTFSPDIRIEEIRQGYQEQLRRIEFACGLSYGTISDVEDTAKTATEIKTSKQRLYATVTDLQKALEQALTDFAQGVYFLSRQIGANLPDPKMSFTWDDSIVTDSDALQAKKLLEFQAGLIDAVKYHMDVYGMDEDKAKKLVLDMEERQPDTPEITFPAEEGESSAFGVTEGAVKEAAQDVAGKRLNGAQVKSLMEVIGQYSAGALSESAAINLIVSAFGMSESEARKLLGVGDT